MEIGPFKPLLTLLALPPALPLLVAALGMSLLRWRRRLALGLAWLGIGSLWLLSSSAVAPRLAALLLPDYPPQSPATLAAARVQAIVVLGGGVTARNPEFGSAQPNGYTLARLRYGVWLARGSGLPMAYSGGIGWSNKGDSPPPPEGEVAQRVLQQDWGQPLRWVDNRARDTHENAEFLAPLLQRDGVHRVALVTSWPHMARSVYEFKQVGFDVVPAPTGYPRVGSGDWLAWLPTVGGLSESWYVLREWLGLQVARARPQGGRAMPPAQSPASIPTEPQAP